MKIIIHISVLFLIIGIILTILLNKFLRVNELINKAKVSRKYFLDNKIKIDQKFFDIVIKKIFVLQLISLIAIIIGISLIFALVFDAIGESNLLGKNRKMFISHIVISSASILITTIIAIFVLNYFNKIKKGLDKWIEENQTFEEFKADTLTKIKQSHYFERSCLLVFLIMKTRTRDIDSITKMFWNESNIKTRI